MKRLTSCHSVLFQFNSGGGGSHLLHYCQWGSASESRDRKFDQSQRYPVSTSSASRGREEAFLSEEPGSDSFCSWTRRGRIAFTCRTVQDCPGGRPSRVVEASIQGSLTEFEEKPRNPEAHNDSFENSKQSFFVKQTIASGKNLLPFWPCWVFFFKSSWYFIPAGTSVQYLN